MGSPALQANSLPAEIPGKHTNNVKCFVFFLKIHIATADHYHLINF